MLINTGQRTDIPAFFAPWLRNRVREGFVMTRNPYFPNQVLRFALDPSVVDLLIFGTKNPAPLLPYLGEFKKFRLYWHVTITPYGPEIERHVPPKEQVMEAFLRLSKLVGPHRLVWRYDPIFVSGSYTVERHIQSFSEMAAKLEGSTRDVVISFLDLYAKTRRNFPEGRTVAADERARLGEAFAEIGRRRGLTLHSCCEGDDLARFGIDTGGCMTKEKLERAIGEELAVPAGKGRARAGCGCLLGGDVGAYNSCPHGCRYCYANFDQRTVSENLKLHDPSSPLLIGNLKPDDEIRQVKQESWLSGQYVLPL